MNPERRVELLAAAPRADLLTLADRCAADEPLPTLVVAPQIGTTVLEVREPVAHEHLHLGEVLATQAGVRVEGGHGQAVRIGGDRLATLAAAICDAEVETAGPLAGDVIELCRRTEALLWAERVAEGAELAPTQVALEELE